MNVLYSFSMGKRGQWTRWGRGMCEGWSLEIGFAFCGSVVLRNAVGQPATWIATINAAALGEYLERDLAMQSVEERIESNMGLVLHDWGRYLADKQER